MEKSGKAPSKTASKAREDRLKKALKANMARRKQQTRARNAKTPTDRGNNETKED